MFIGWTTLASLEEAEKLAQEIVEARLAVCAQVDGPIRSYYVWENKVENDQEYRVVIKFVADVADKLEAWIDKNHPYEVPQWLAVPIDRVAPSYRQWAEGQVVVKETRKPKKDVLRLSKQGRNLLRKGRFADAEKAFLEALELDQKNAYILVGLGDTYRELKKFEQAIKYYDRVLAFDSMNVFALRGIGDAYRGTLQHKRAIPFWLRYLECNKDDIYVMVRLAESFNKTGNFEKAESFYLQALKVNGRDKYALLGLGSLYYKVEDDDQALIYFDRLLDLDNSYVAVLTMVGNIYRRRKGYEKAAKYYERAAELESWNSFALYGLGDCQRGMGNLEMAVSWWSKILEREPNNQDLLTRVGDAMLNLDRWEEAVQHYMRSLSVGFDLYALLGLSRGYRNRSHFEEAEKCCQQILDKVPGHQRAIHELVEVYTGMGDEGRARQMRQQLEA